MSDRCDDELVKQPDQDYMARLRALEDEALKRMEETNE